MKKTRAQNWFGRAMSRITEMFGRLDGAAPGSVLRSHVWHPLASAAFDASNMERLEIVRLARAFEYNNHLVNRLADIFEAYTVGCETPVNPSSGDVEWNQRAHDVWRNVSRHAVVNSRMSFGQFQSLVARRWFIDGEVFILLTRGNGGAPRLQMVETHLVGTPDSLKSAEGKTIFGGIQCEPLLGGRPVSYHIGREENGRIIFDAPPVEEKFVVHVFEPMRAGQLHGLPFCTPVINLLRDLDDLHRYEMQCAKDASTFGPYIKTATGEIDPATLRIGRVRKSAATLDGTKNAEVEKAEYYQSAGSSIRVLQRGDDIVLPSSQRPSATTQQYWRMVQEQVCNGIGIPYVLAYPESLQGTTYRGTLATTSAMFRARAALLGEAWSRCYEYLMQYEVAVNPKLRPSPLDWSRVSIQPPRAPDVDVGYSSQAALAELSAGLTNYEIYYSARGMDWREQLQKLAEQREYARALGLLGGENKNPNA